MTCARKVSCKGGKKSNMPYIQVGVIAARDESGNFQPSRPIYIEAADREVLPSGMTKKQAADNEDFTEYMVQRFKVYQRAARKAQRKAELEKKARQLNIPQMAWDDDALFNL